MSDIDDITHRVEADRARLATSLDRLTDTVNPQTIADEISSAATGFGGELATRAMGSVRDNPAGALLVAIGAGLLASGSQKRSVPYDIPDANGPTEAMVGFDDRLAAADAQMRGQMTGELQPRPQASRMRAAIDSGLDKLPPKARLRVIKARQAALSAQESIERYTATVHRKTRGFLYEQPLTAGALALGFGVVAASLLPGTRREDELMGRRRDALMADARNAMEEEMLKAKEQAEDMISSSVGAEPQALRG